MAGPLSGLGASSQIISSQQLQSAQSAYNNNSRDAEKLKQDNTATTVQGAPVSDAKDTATESNADVKREENQVLLASKDEQTVRDETERGSVLDISV